MVQVEGGPIGEILDRLRAILTDFEKVNVQRSKVTSTMVFRYESEAVPKVIRKLKVEINAREHFTLLGHHYINYAVNSGWFKGSTQIPTFFLEEMLATKLRALYQRRKGRDLFDLYTVMNEQEINLLNVVDMMHEYLRREGTKITSADFIANLD
ncbi:MAG: nucleotidyl transferase AbiEii/AbiGii toxin family protein, partial [Cyclobacteriaceae bacterium]|nr:nucleotidyl transferase AbiEii/AbiGii toxin family protein [Cyclobacteriaceae bacterium]